MSMFKRSRFKLVKKNANMLLHFFLFKGYKIGQFNSKTGGYDLMRVIRIFILLMTILSITGLFTWDSQCRVFSAEAQLPLLVEPIYPENQNPQTKGYFDLHVKPGDKFSLSVRLTNKKDEEVTVRMKSANAFTNPSGGMMYEQEIDSTDTVLLEDAVRMADYMKIEEIIVVPPLSSVDIPIEVIVPETSGETLLGGLLFTTQGQATEEQQDVEEGKANFVIKTETVFAIAVQFNLPGEVAQDFFLGKAGFLPQSAHLFIEMTNNAQKIQEDILGTYTLLDNEEIELFKGEFGPFKMAPKSRIRLPFQWGHETLASGTYTVIIEGTFGGERITASEGFQIGDEDVEEYVEKTRPVLPEAQINKGIPTWIWIAGAILIGIIMFYIGKRRAL
jgi:hypothetical protein